MSIKRLSQTGGDPVPLSEIKAHLRVDSADEDTLIGEYARAAADHIESITSVVLSTTSYQQRPVCFAEHVSLARRPVQQVQQVELRQNDGSWVQVSSLLWAFDDIREVILPTGKDYRITFLAGFDATNPVPDDLKQAYLLLISYFFENRAYARGSLVDLPTNITTLIAPYKEVRI